MTQSFDLILMRHKDVFRCATLTLMVIACLSVTRSHASADELGTHVYMQFGTSTENWTGDLGTATNSGIGFHLMHGIHFGNLGAYVNIRRSFHLASHDPPPSDTGLQTSRLGAGLRASHAAGAFRGLLGAEYTHLFWLTNPLREQTGARSSHHALAFHTAVRAEMTLPLYFELGAEVVTPIGVPASGVMVGLTFSAGVAGSLR